MTPLFIALALTLGLQSARAQAQSPAPLTPDHLLLEQIYDKQTQIDRLKFNSRWPQGSAIKKLEKENTDLIQQLTAAVPEMFSKSEPWVQLYPAPAIAQTRQDVFIVHALDAFAYSGTTPKAFYLMETHRSKAYQLALRNTLTDDKNKGVPLKAKITCGQAYRMKIGIKVLNKNPGESVEFKFLNRPYVQDNYFLEPVDQNLSSCSFTFQKENESADSENKYGARLIKENEHDQAYEHIRQSFQACVLPKANQLSGAKAFFLSNKYRQLTCPEEVPFVEALEDGQEGFLKRMEALTGQALPQDILKKQNPYEVLDFSKAPKLDLIIVSYLVFKSDVSGQLTAQALKWHADHGTQVRILTAEVLQEVKDKKLLFDLAASNGNIKLIEYKYFIQAKRGSFLDGLHRTNHVKILLTYSATQEKANQIFVGGRNIHDGFMYRQAPNYKDYPALVDYQNKDEEFFSFWRDFEVKIVSRRFTEDIAAHFFTMWDEEGSSQFVRSYNLDLSSQESASEKYFAKDYIVRHLISVPFKEDQQLEIFFSDMIDSAKHKVLLSTPYFRPTKMIYDSLQRAIKRGVEITLITRLDLKGDVVDWILSDVNKDGVNQFLNQIKIYEYTEPSVILHSKLVMIDAEMTLVGSVNLNKRSFVHDTENAILIYSPKFTQSMEKLYAVYMEKSQPIKEEQDINFWKRLIIFIFDDKF